MVNKLIDLLGWAFGGYIRIQKVRRGNELNAVFKVHNSWGIEWQQANNDCWVDADLLMAAAIREPNQDENSGIQSAAVIWLEP